MTISPAATIILTRAAGHPDCFLEFSRKLPPGARCKMIDAMLRDGLIAETAGDYRQIAMVEDAETDTLRSTLRMTAAGFTAIGQEPPTMTEADIEEELDLLQVEVDAENAADEAVRATQAGDGGSEARPDAEAPEDPAVGSIPAGLRRAALAVLAVWDGEVSRPTALAGPMASLRAILAGSKPRAASAHRKPRKGTKQEAVLTLLRRAEGATIIQIMDATSWASHTVRGFFAGLKKKGVNVEVKERVKQSTSGKQREKGSYSIYHVATPAA
jgi:hypothetical protein